MPRTRKSPIEVGVTTFHATYDDGNPLWKVVRKSGASAYICVSQPEIITLADGRLIEGDYAGIEKAFTKREIEAALRWANTLSTLGNEQASYFASLIPGMSVIHYDNGFGNFVRLQIVEKDGENVGQPIALVGKWGKHDLPRRQADGSINLGYYGEKIVNGTGAWQPSITCIYEHPSYSERKRSQLPNPADAKPIDLSVPDMTPAEAVEAQAELIRQEIVRATERVTGSEAVANVINVLRRHRLVNA